MNKKVFIFLPDGVGLRNFAFTQFKDIGAEKGYEIVYWNNTVFSLKEELGYEEVKIEKSFSNDTDIKNIEQLSSFMIDSSVWSADPKANSALTLAKLNTTKSSTGSDSIVGFESTSNKAEVSNFHLKLIKMANGNFDRAILVDDGSKLITQEITEKVIDRVAMKSTKIQIWNLAPEKPTFLGVQIKNLYDFFMVFVFMAGASSVILFFLSKKLLKMMHGVQ